MKVTHLPHLDVLGAPIGDYLHCAGFFASKHPEVLKLLSRHKEVSAIDMQVGFILLCLCNSYCRDGAPLFFKMPFFGPLVISLVSV